LLLDLRAASPRATDWTVRTFRDTQGSNRVGLIVEIPDISLWEQVLQSAEGADAMKYDGVRPETIVVMAEG
jgi:hypothetical protein